MNSIHAKHTFFTGLVFGILTLLAACSQEPASQQEQPGAPQVNTPQAGGQPAGSQQAATTQATAQQGAAGSNVIAFRDALIIVGNGTIIDTGTLVVQDGRILAVGSSDQVTTPEGARRVSLEGATVMPMMVDTHVHLSTDRNSLIEDLAARARFGVSAAMSLGMDNDDAVFLVKDADIPGAARYFTAGRGITRPEPGRTEAPHWVNTPDEARAAVQMEAARGVDIIKIWVDDRNGQYPKMTPLLNSAVIDEAHSQGLRVTAHIFTLEDAKSLVEAGVDAFAHGVRDRIVDEEFETMVTARPDLVLVPNLPNRGVPTDYSWLEDQVPDEEFERLMALAPNPDVQPAFNIQATNLDILNDAGMTIAMGTDGNTPWAAHVEIEDMVLAGMTPRQAIRAATANGAAFLGIDDAGTLEVGKSADFIILDANPLVDITNTRRIRDVYLRGEQVER